MSFRPTESRAQEPTVHEGRSPAVALNYCRAAFHRIRKYQSKQVLCEERDEILNNLNLNEIADEEVIRLYGGVLEEIGGIQIAAKERVVLNEKHRRILRQQLLQTGFALTTTLLTQDYIGAIRTGAASWWDYRAVVWTRDFESWQIDKSRMVSFMDKSSQFLDTFWKMARKRNIPDRWLVRNQDLDDLEEAMREQNLETRLRILKRMEGFMEAYPPYWYYVGRTEQALGQLFAAAQTFEKLEELGRGHFRKDKMLAAATANRAAIQDYLKQPGADETARKALGYSIDVWEVNLLCAQVLARHGHFDEAEDAVLRNLDVGLEQEQSQATLLSIYSLSKDFEKLNAKLVDPNIIRTVPMPTLLQLAANVGVERLPPSAAETLRTSLYGYFELRFGRDDLILTGTESWYFSGAQLAAVIDGHTFAQPEIPGGNGRSQARFRGVFEAGNPLQMAAAAAPVTIVLIYPGAPEIRLRLAMTGEPGSGSDAVLASGDGSWSQYAIPRSALRLVTVDVGDTNLALTAPMKNMPHSAGPAMPNGAPSPALKSLPSLLGTIQAPNANEVAEPDLGAPADGLPAETPIEPAGPQLPMPKPESKDSESKTTSEPPSKPAEATIQEVLPIPPLPAEPAKE